MTLVTSSEMYSWTISSPARAPVFSTSRETCIVPSGFGTAGAIEIPEDRIAQAMAERVERSINHRFLFLSIQILCPDLRAALVWKIIGNLADGFWERERQLTGRIVIPEQKVGNRGSEEFISPPGFDDGRHEAVDPIDRQWAAIHQNNDHGLPCFLQSLG